MLSGADMPIRESVFAKTIWHAFTSFSRALVKGFTPKSLPCRRRKLYLHALWGGHAHQGERLCQNNLARLHQLQPCLGKGIHPQEFTMQEKEALPTCSLGRTCPSGRASLPKQSGTPSPASAVPWSRDSPPRVYHAGEGSSTYMLSGADMPIRESVFAKTIWHAFTSFSRALV